MNNLFPPHKDIHEKYDLKGSSIGREYPEEKALNDPGAILKDLNWVHREREIRLGPFKKNLFEEQLKRDVALLQRLNIMDYSLLTGIHDMGRGNSEKLRDGMLTVFQPDTAGRLRRRPTQRGDFDRPPTSGAGDDLRRAVQRTDPKAIAVDQPNTLPDKDRSERRYFMFYQDEGGLRATDDVDHNLNTIYYLGIIDILTPYNWYKRVEHFWRSLEYDKVSNIFDVLHDWEADAVHASTGYRLFRLRNMETASSVSFYRQCATATRAKGPRWSDCHFGSAQRTTNAFCPC